MYEIITESENPQLTTLNEMMVQVQNSLPTDVEQSIYYAKLKHLLHPEIFNFCKEQIELKQDLNLFRMSVGKPMVEKEIREYIDNLKQKYNEHYENVGLDYHIEVTRYDYGVPVFVVIKRTEIFMKKFVFRFKKERLTDGIANLSQSGLILNTLKKGSE